MSISQKTIEKIKKEKIAPLPRWRFLLRNDLIWTAALVSTVVGSVVAAMIFHVSLNRDWFIYTAPHRLSALNLFLDLPLIWLTLLALTLYIAYYNVYHSKSGYKYSLYLIVLGSLAFSIVLGGLWDFYGIGAKVEAGIAHKIPFYSSVEKREIEIWSNPEEGHLGGLITAKSDQNFELKDPGNKVWQVDTGDADCICAGPITVGEKVKIIGEEINENQFKAEQIHLWDGCEPRGLFHYELSPSF